MTSSGTTTPTDFAIAELSCFHVAFSDQPSYWEDYKGAAAGRSHPDAGSDATPDSPTAGSDGVLPRFEFRHGWQTVYPCTVETILLRVRLVDGAIGWGEANCPIGPEVAGLIAGQLLQPMAAGRDFESPLALWNFLYDAQRGRGYASGYWLDAMAALDIAVYDALGRREGVTVASLLCEAPRRQIPVYLSGLRRATRQDRLEHLRAWLDTGLRGVKMFLDGDIDAGVAEVEFLQAGAEVEEWMVDTLWMVAPARAAEARRRYGDLGCRWLECPLEPEDLEGHRQLLRHPGAPIALGEHFRTHYQTEAWFEPSPALEVFQPDIGRTGLSDGLRQLRQATAAGVPTTPHMGNGLGPFQAATLHFAAACGDEYLQEFQAGLAERAALVGTTAWQYSDGGFQVPDTPGLGVEIDEQALARYAAR